MRVGATDLEGALRGAHRRFQRRPVVEVATGEGVGAPQFVDRALEDHLSALGAGAGTEIDDVVGDRDGLGLVFDDEHGVALVAQLQQQVVHPRDVVRVHADRRFVEHVGDVGQRRSEMADHLDALRFSTGQGAGGAIERQIPQPDVREGVEQMTKVLQ